jgi:hypothetical protein
MKEVLIKDEAGFKLRLKAWKCVSPKELNALEFTQESINADGEVGMSSTYQFFMTDAELAILAEGVKNVI